ncbi:hypothetical protein I4F81_001621 [Pyropia yezoensis]|uniref:Uncharacterized protein n=1 Tax=Pyropia yezoensis TaxID=2788 RepID=A0ACC3BN60_PYRYE|nr:hypothetical protein I4F81_001621 [Neopyropia yezoensis]
MGVRADAGRRGEGGGDAGLPARELEGGGGGAVSEWRPCTGFVYSGERVRGVAGCRCLGRNSITFSHTGGGSGGGGRQLALSAGVAGLIVSARGAAEWARSVELRTAGSSVAAATALAGVHGQEPPLAAEASMASDAAESGPAVASVNAPCPSTLAPGQARPAVDAERPPAAAAGSALAVTERGVLSGGAAATATAVRDDGRRGSDGGAPARVGAGVVAATADAAATRACGGTPRGTVGEVLASVSRLLATPDPRWPVDAVATAAYRQAPTTFWSRFRRSCEGEAAGVLP